MPTKFSKIYERAVFKFTDYTFLTTTTEVKEEVLKQYLISAITDFQGSCYAFDLTKYDLEKQEFEEDLSDEIIEILALGIAYYWLKAHTYDTKLFRNLIYKSDYTTYSPANLLTSMRSLAEATGKDYFGKINSYSFRNSDYRKLKP